MKKFNIENIIFLKNLEIESDSEDFIIACEMCEDGETLINVLNQQQYRILLAQQYNGAKNLMLTYKANIVKYQVIPTSLLATKSFYNISYEAKNKINKIIESVEEEISEIKLQRIVSILNFELKKDFLKKKIGEKEQSKEI